MKKNHFNNLVFPKSLSHNNLLLINILYIFGKGKDFIEVTRKKVPLIKNTRSFTTFYIYFSQIYIYTNVINTFRVGKGMGKGLGNAWERLYILFFPININYN